MKAQVALSLVITAMVLCGLRADEVDYRVKALEEHRSKAGGELGEIELWTFSMPVADTPRYKRLLWMAESGAVLAADELAIFFENANTDAVSDEDRSRVYEASAPAGSIDRLIEVLEKKVSLREPELLKNLHAGMILFWRDGKGRSRAVLMDSTTDLLLGKSSLSKELLSELLTLKLSPLKESSAQADALQPATAPDSKSEGSKKSKPESEGRSQ